MYIRRTLLAASLLAASALPSWSASYYVAPTGAKISCPSDGSLKCPWPSVAAAFGSKKIVGGDTILLMDGSHGEIKLNKLLFDKPVTIQSQNGKNAHLDSILLGDAIKNITFRDMTVWRPEGGEGGSLVRSYPGSLNVTIEGLEIRSRADSVNYMNWSQARWLSVVSNAVWLRGSYNVVRNNTLTGVGQGITVSENSLVEGNVIDGFAWDGLRGQSNSIFRNNLVMNCFKVDKTHRDGFQSYSKSTVQNLTIEGNIILTWAKKASSPLRCSVQGISLFDGYYDDLVIQNNVVATDHYNGITVLGTRRATVTNNTVVNIDGTSGKAPWLKIGATKAGKPSKDVLVANNLANSLQGGDVKNNIVFTSNAVLLYPAKVLQDIVRFNYRPKADSGFIDKAIVTYAPKVDVLTAARPSGSGPDMGAFEVGSTAKMASSLPLAIQRFMAGP